jgi:hypothetical protein
MEGFSGRSEREFDVGWFVRRGVAMRTAWATGPRAGTECLVDDRLHGTRASPTFNTAAKAVIDLLGVSRQVHSRVHGAADIVVRQDVAGTNDHKKTAAPSVMLELIY